MAEPADTARADDVVQPFQIDLTALRGRLVRLGPLVDTIISRHGYPEPVGAILGEAIALAVLLAGMLKYDGVFTLQTKGDGPIRTMVADVTTAGAVRGYAQFDEETLPAPSETASVPRLLGKGYIAFTVDQGEHTDRYQGIVELSGESLAECAHHYFRQSEQLQASIVLASGRAGGGWRAGGIMIQRLPDEGGRDAGAPEEREEIWNRARILMGSSTRTELLDPDLPPNDLLFRLFHEDGVRVQRPLAVDAKCRCTVARVDRVIRMMTPEEIEEMSDDGRIVVTCEFCNARYVYDGDAVRAVDETLVGRA